MKPIYTPMDCLEEFAYKIHNYQPTGRVLAIRLSYIADRVNGINNEDMSLVNEYNEDISFVKDCIDELRSTYKDRAKELQIALEVAINGHEAFNQYLDDMGV